MSEMKLSHKNMALLQQRVKELETENAYLRRLVPNSAEAQETLQTLGEIHQTLKEAQEYRREYNVALQEMQTAKQQYTREVDALLNRLRRSVVKYT